MLAIQVFSDTGMLADLTGRIDAAPRFSTNEQGFAALEIPLVAMSIDEAFEAYAWPGTPRIVVTDFTGATVWEGRVEDVSIVPGGIALAAFGYQRAFHDVPYTALWSRTGTGGWDEADESVRGTPGRYEMDNNNRLYIAPKKGEVFSSLAQSGELTYALPHNGVRSVAHFSASYDLLLPSGWEMRLLSFAYDYSDFVQEAVVTATGSAQSGTWDITTAARQRLVFAVRIPSGSTTITDETGVNYARLTNIRIKSTTASTVTASAIATALAEFINSVNPSQMSAASARIATTATDLRDEVYEDEYPAEILDRLALLHGYEWGVWEGRTLHFRERASAGRHWYVDVVGGLNLQRSLENVRNSAYGVYRDAAGSTMRTAGIGDGDSQTRYGLTRRGYVSVQTTSQSEAITHRGMWLADRAAAQDRARIEFNCLFDAAGAVWPLYSIRAGDRVTMRNLPPTLGAEIDRIRTFVVGETAYDAGTGEMSISPDEPTPTLVTLVARRGAGL